LRLTDAAYPVRLRQIANPPPLLFVQGDLASLNDPQLAIVGSRNPTTHGEQIAFDFSKSLARSGLIITSGLALGIDAAAHRGALAAGGITIAVAATGLDRIYPARNQELAWRIIEQGAIVSEFPVGTPILAQNFPQRNRIISGLCLGTLVVEARARSGSLMTARYALEQGREVFAVPGAINNPLVRGCHALIREGATLVECLDNILTELGPLLVRACPAVATASETASGNALLDEEYRRLLDCLGVDEPTAVDTLVGRTGLTAHSVSSMLLLLEMQGYVSSLPGGLYIRHR
jgi:DNA processing protein